MIIGKEAESSKWILNILIVFTPVVLISPVQSHLKKIPCWFVKVKGKAC